jgi:hypothetical protein
VFAAAQHGPVLIEGRSGERLVIETEAAAGHWRRLAEEASRVLALDSVDAADYPTLPGFAWTADLDVEDRQAMATALQGALRRAMETQSWDDYDLVWYGWRESARVLADRELTARLLAPSEEADFVPVRRP